MSRCLWLIYERGDRWSRAVERFAPAMLPAGCDFRRETRPAASGSRSPAASGSQSELPTVVLYELAGDGWRERLQMLAGFAAEQWPPLQIVAFAPELRLPERSEPQLIAALRALGAAAVLRHPEQLPPLGRLVTRYANRERLPPRRRL